MFLTIHVFSCSPFPTLYFLDICYVGYTLLIVCRLTLPVHWLFCKGRNTSSTDPMLSISSIVSLRPPFHPVYQNKTINSCFVTICFWLKSLQHFFPQASFSLLLLLFFNKEFQCLTDLSWICFLVLWFLGLSHSFWVIYSSCSSRIMNSFWLLLGIT